MNRRPFLESYEGQTIQQLIAMKGSYRIDSRYYANDEPVADALFNYIEQRQHEIRVP